jgi:hypothetical protein
MYTVPVLSLIPLQEHGNIKITVCAPEVCVWIVLSDHEAHDDVSGST